MSVYIQYRHSHHRLNYIVHASNNINIVYLNIFNPSLEFVDSEPAETKGHLYPRFLLTLRKFT